MTDAELAALPPEKVPYNSTYRAEGRIVGPKWPIALVSAMAALIAVLDVSIVNVALPSIRASVGGSIQDTSWISTGYIVSNVIVIPMTGFLARRVGYRAYFAGSLVLFTIASMLCGISWNLWSLVVFRAMQGLGGGALIPTASSILIDRFPRKERNMAMAMFAMGAMTGPLLGPTLGGWLTDQFSWHMIFFINVPIGLIELMLILALLREDRTGMGGEPVDWPGIGYLIGWLSTMQYLLEEGTGEGWFDSELITGLTVVSTTFFLLFVDRELSTPHPLVKLRFFRDRQYLTGTLINMGIGLALFGSIFLFSLFCGVVMGYTASNTGNMMFFAAGCQVFVMPLIGRFGGLVDPRKMVAFGVTMLILSLFQYTRLSGQESWFNLLVPQLFRATGMGFIMIPVSTLALDRIPVRDIGDATGLFSLTRELGGSIGTAGLATLVAERTTFHASRIAESVSVFSPVAVGRFNQMVSMLGARLGDPDRAVTAAYGSLQGSVMRQSLILAFDDAFSVSTSIAVGMLLIVLLMRRPTQTTSMPAGH